MEKQEEDEEEEEEEAEGRFGMGLLAPPNAGKEAGGVVVVCESVARGCTVCVRHCVERRELGGGGGRSNKTLSAVNVRQVSERRQGHNGECDFEPQFR